jgi:hypothetical protein
MEDTREGTRIRGDKRAAKRRKARYGMAVSGKSAKLHHALALRRGLSKRVQKALQRSKASKAAKASKTKDSSSS